MADKDRSDIVKDSSDTSLGNSAETGEEACPEAQARLEARRRVILGGLATAPVILTLSSRPALSTGSYGGGGADACGPSGMLSGNLSNVDSFSGCRGKSPEYWQTQYDKCKSHFNPGPCNPITSYGGTCDDYSVPTKYELNKHIQKLSYNYYQNKSEIKKCKEYKSWLTYYPNSSPPFGTKFSDIFGSGLTHDNKTTCMQALCSNSTTTYGSGGSSPILAHCVAAYCNAREFGKSDFGLSPQELADLVASMMRTDPLGLQDILEEMNSRG